MARLVVALVSAILLGACGKNDDQFHGIKIERNPAPTEAFRLYFHIQDAPGPLSKVRAEGFYRVETEGCVKPQRFSGAVLNPDDHIEVPLTALGDNRFAGVFYRDAMIDADYYGLGVCHWQLQNVIVRFASPATDFVASISNPRNNQGPFEPVENVFLHRDYFAKPEPMTNVFGEKPGFYLPAMGQQFRITITAEPL